MRPTYEATAGLKIFGHKETKALSSLLVASSIFFVVEPMPNNTWAFFVKNESIDILNSLKLVATDIVAYNEICRSCHWNEKGADPESCEIYRQIGKCKFAGEEDEETGEMEL